MTQTHTFKMTTLTDMHCTHLTHALKTHTYKLTSSTHISREHIDTPETNCKKQLIYHDHTWHTHRERAHTHNCTERDIYMYIYIYMDRCFEGAQQTRNAHMHKHAPSRTHAHTHTHTTSNEHTYTQVGSQTPHESPMQHVLQDQVVHDLVLILSNTFFFVSGRCSLA